MSNKQEQTAVISISCWFVPSEYSKPLLGFFNFRSSTKFLFSFILFYLHFISIPAISTTHFVEIGREMVEISIIKSTVNRDFIHTTGSYKLIQYFLFIIIHLNSFDKFLPIRKILKKMFISWFKEFHCF